VEPHRLLGQARATATGSALSNNDGRGYSPGIQACTTSSSPTVAMDLSLGPDGNIYVATHGRGIWRTSAAGL
jgi:hypothetical protein